MDARCHVITNCPNIIRYVIWNYCHRRFHFVSVMLYCWTVDALVAMEKAMKRDSIDVNDRQLACAHIQSQEGQDYLKGMAAAANYAWVNRSSMTFLCRQVCQRRVCLFVCSVMGDVCAAVHTGVLVTVEQWRTTKDFFNE